MRVRSSTGPILVLAAALSLVPLTHVRAGSMEESYAAWQTSILDGAPVQAIQPGEELDAILARQSPAGQALRTRFPLAFYGLPFARVAREMTEIPPDTSPVQVDMLLIAPDTWMPGTDKHPALERSFRLFSRLMHHLSRGRLSITIQSVWISPADLGPLTAFVPSAPDGMEARSVLDAPAMSTALRTILARLFPRNPARFDTIILCHETDAVRPSAWVFGAPPSPGPSRKTAGLLSLPIQQTDTQDPVAPWAGVLVHEYFHLVENRYGISPKHGFAPSRGYTARLRDKFPSWTGQEQYDYYDWHFHSTIDPAGYERILHP